EPRDERARGVLQVDQLHAHPARPPLPAVHLARPDHATDREDRGRLAEDANLDLEEAPRGDWFRRADEDSPLAHLERISEDEPPRFHLVPDGHAGDVPATIATR